LQTMLGYAIAYSGLEGALTPVLDWHDF
jgi:hypothetical protein